MSDFVIRAYGVQELALLYFPHNTPQAASAQLKKWIKRPPLLHLLLTAGYHSGQKILTPRLVEILTEHIGFP